MIKFLLPLMISFSFIFESIFVELMPESLYKSDFIVVPHFLIVMILFTVIYSHRKQGLMYGFIFGLLFDIVYTEIIGVYLVLIPLVVYIVSWIMKLLQSNIVVSIVITLFGVCLLEFGAYGMNFLIGLTAMSFSSFVGVRLWPTLLLNFIFILIVVFPLKKYFENYHNMMRND